MKDVELERAQEQQQRTGGSGSVPRSQKNSAMPSLTTRIRLGHLGFPRAG